MNSIDLQNLSGYQEDPKGLRDFQRPYLAPSLAGVVIALAGFVLLISEMEASHYYRGQQMGFLDKLWFGFQKLAKGAGVQAGVDWFIPPTIFIGGLLLAGLTMLVMSRATPVSSISNLKMEKYWNANADPGCTEIVYVDRSSKTYFRRVFVRRGGRYN